MSRSQSYTYDYFSPKFLSAEGVTFDKKTKTIEPAGYKAVVLYQDWLDADGAAKLLAWAKKGLKVVVLEGAAVRTPFDDGRDQELATTMRELKKLPTVRRAKIYDRIADYFSATPGGYRDNVMAKLQNLGVYPYVGYASQNQQLLTQTREDEDGNRYVYVYNYDDGSYRSQSLLARVRSAPNPGTNIKTDLVVEGEYLPYVIDAWTGEVTQLAEYSWDKGNTVVPIDLDYNNVALLAFKKTPRGHADQPLRIERTNGHASYAIHNGVAVRATKSGHLHTRLSNGTRRVERVKVPKPFDIKGWSLTVSSWKPNATERNLVRTETIDGLTTQNTLTSTVQTPINVSLDTLTTWDNIPEVGRAVSGTGHYEASFAWHSKTASGAYLDFGDHLNESMKVWINGHKVGGHISTNPTKVKRDVGGVGKPTIDDGTGRQVPLVGVSEYTGGDSLTKPIIDVSRYLKDGTNRITIEYSSTLQNLQLSRGAVPEQTKLKNWWGNDQVYLSYGPAQAKIVPFVEVRYSERGQSWRS